MKPTLTKLNNVYIYTSENGQQYVRLYKDKWMLYEGDDEIVYPESLEQKFITLKETTQLYDDETIDAMQQLLNLIKQKKITPKQITKLYKRNEK